MRVVRCAMWRNPHCQTSVVRSVGKSPWELLGAPGHASRRAPTVPASPPTPLLSTPSPRPTPAPPALALPGLGRISVFQVFLIMNPHPSCQPTGAAVSIGTYSELRSSTPPKIPPQKNELKFIKIQKGEKLITSIIISQKLITKVEGFRGVFVSFMGSIYL